MKCLHILKACLIHHFIQFQVYLAVKQLYNLLKKKQTSFIAFFFL